MNEKDTKYGNSQVIIGYEVCAARNEKDETTRTLRLDPKFVEKYSEILEQIKPNRTFRTTVRGLMKIIGVLGGFTFFN